VATVRSRNADSGNAPKSFGVMIVLNVSDGEMRASLRCCLRLIPYTLLVSVVGGSYSRSISRIKYFPPFFFFSISNASSEYFGAMTPSETSRLMIFAVGTYDTQVNDRLWKKGLFDIRRLPQIVQSCHQNSTCGQHLVHGRRLAQGRNFQCHLYHQPCRPSSQPRLGALQ
jgi:hypothetical protein